MLPQMGYHYYQSVESARYETDRAVNRVHMEVSRWRGKRRKTHKLLMAARQEIRKLRDQIKTGS